MTIDEEILEIFRVLPEKYQQEVLDFIRFLKQKYNIQSESDIISEKASEDEEGIYFKND